MPFGVFCTRCGAHQGTTREFGDPRTRLHRYAAHPSEHVLQPVVFTTLFPHLGHDKVHEFRWAFLIGVGAIVLLFATGLILAAILVAALLLPLLYLVYFYEAQVYRDDPVRVIALTLGGGFAVGVVLTLLTHIAYQPFLDPVNPLGAAGTGVGFLLLVGLVLPTVQEAAKALPPFLMPKRIAFPETVDGLVFGIASGLGFALAEAVVGFAGALTHMPAQVSPAGWLFTLASLAIFQPLLQGGATGLVVVAIWRYRRNRASRREIGAVVAALGAHVAFAFGTQWMREAQIDGLFILVWQAALVSGLMICIRYVVHLALLDEAANIGYAETVCPSCHVPIVAAGFCPTCGIALSAAPSTVKRGRRPRTDVTAAVARKN
ncbi:MAG: PrsW family glutamic-type intramembrane protease [Candidatus Dormibacterales bacterium]